MAEITGDLSTEMGVTWKLRDFSRIPANVDSRLKSPPFSLFEADWRLELYPNGKSLEDSEGYIDIYLRRENFSIARQRVKATFSLENHTGRNCESFTCINSNERNDSWGLTKFIVRSQLENKKHSLLPDDTLTVHCHIRAEASSDNSGVSKEELPETDSSAESVDTGALPRKHLDASSLSEMPDACKGAGDLPRTSPRFLDKMAEITGDLSTEIGVTWKLRDFFRIPANVDSRLRSPPFSLSEAIWRLELYPNGKSSEDSEGYIDIFLRRENFSDARQKVQATFSLKNCKGKNFKSWVCMSLYEENHSWGWAKYMARSKLEKRKHSLLPDGTLTVHCRIGVENYSDDSGASEEESSETDSSVESVDVEDLPQEHLDVSSLTETPDACKGAGDLPRIPRFLGKTAEITGDLSTEMGVTWKLRDFFRILANADSRLQSPSFSLSEADWRLELYPNGESLEDSEGYIAIFLRRENFSIARQRVQATFSLKSRRGKNCESYTCINLYEQNDSWGSTKFIAISQLENRKRSLLPEGTLTVHCQIRAEPSSDDSGASEKELSKTDSFVESVDTGVLPREHLDASSLTETPDACKGAGDLPRTSPRFPGKMAEITGDLSTEMGVTWKLRDFSRIPATVDSRLKSPPFSLSEADWRLELYPNGRSLEDSEGYIDIFLRRENFFVDWQRVFAVFSLQNCKGKNRESYNTIHSYKQNYCWGLTRFIARSKLEDKKHSFLPDGTLTVHCRIRARPSSEESATSEEESSETDSSWESIDMEDLPRRHLDASSRTETPDACKGDGDLTRTSPSVQELQTDNKKLL